jgi:2-polyprenyl-3-methyl-5-hydroxy-6-metoxy-1,4-benzoquinol methylase
MGSPDCWVCGSVRSAPWKARSINRPLEPSDFQITDFRYGSTLALHRCSECRFIFADPSSVHELVALYERLDDPEYESTQDTRALQMRWLLDLTCRARPAARTWLDIGAGAGLLVSLARARGLDASGVEPSHSLVQAAQHLHGIELHQGIFPHPDLAGRRFDVISLVDVIEHVSDPVGLLRACREALTPDGVVLVVTPDVSSVLARRLGPHWWHFRLAHVGYFDRATLGRAARNAGLDAPNWWRARWFFRVAYLAERLGHYLPLGTWNRFALRTWPLSWIYQRVIPLNLFDSWVTLLTRKPEN